MIDMNREFVGLFMCVCGKGHWGSLGMVWEVYIYKVWERGLRRRAMLRI